MVLYGLTGVERDVAVDGALGALGGLARLARDLTGAQSAAITLLDGDCLVVVAATPGVPLGSSPGGRSLCANVLGRHGEEVFMTADASLDPCLRDNPWVSGESGSIRSYAGAPLVGQEGVALGLLCVWSEEPHALTLRQVSVLAALSKAALHSLDERRRVRALWPLPAHSPAPAPGPVPANPSQRPPAHVGIDHVINNRLVRTLFQPLVHLSSATVVGFEALSRGPEGTDLEAPTALLEAARGAGRLGELDWVCRANALQVALDSRLHPSLSWFINVEPAGLASPCPEDLEAVQAQARTALRVVLELSERDINGYVTHLLTAADQARQSTWGVSLDDVGTETMSLALLPLLHPDVVKLDMRLLARQSAKSTASITAAVRAYAERRGAVILAEGIETTEQAQLAVVFGATYGQGYLYGRPAPLPASVPVPREAIPLRQVSPPTSALTPFELVSAECGTQRARKEHLLHISEHLEQQGQHAVMASVLLSCFQRATFFTSARRAQYTGHAAVNAYTVAVGQGFPAHLTPRYRLAPLDAGNRLAQEWIVILLSPHYAAALVARDCGDTGPDRDRRFDFAYTHDRHLVILAAHSFLFHSGNPDENLQTRPDAIGAPVADAGRSAHVEQAPPVVPPPKSRWRRG